jgi:phosphate transport system protein
MINIAIDELKKDVIEYTVNIKKMLLNSTKGVFDRDSGLLENVITVEEDMSDKANLNLYENCVNAIAKFQPVAKNLRIIISIVKMSSNLERIGDHCVNIAQSGQTINLYRQVKLFVDLPEMKDLVIDMLEKSSIAFVSENTDIAKKVLTMDDKVDNYKRKINKELEEYMTDKEILHCIVEIINIVNNLERIADLSVNICEEVIYMESGEIVTG